MQISMHTQQSVFTAKARELHKDHLLLNSTTQTKACGLIRSLHAKKPLVDHVRCLFCWQMGFICGQDWGKCQKNYDHANPALLQRFTLHVARSDREVFCVSASIASRSAKRSANNLWTEWTSFKCGVLIWLSETARYPCRFWHLSKT